MARGKKGPDRQLACDDCGPLEYALLDGYTVGDRLLEGVKFQIRPKGSDGWEARFHDPRSEYVQTLKHTHWKKAAEEFAAETDVLECPRCGYDILVN